MDLVQTVRKEGTRGGRGEFKWDDVKNSSHRENYLGHSLMAPVGRWQKNKDLSWYAKGEGEAEKTEAEIRKEEIKMIKQAEEEAIARALGQDVPPRVEAGHGNPNLAALGGDDKDRRLITNEKETQGAIETENDPTRKVRSGRSERRANDDKDGRRHRKREHRDQDYRRRDRSGDRDDKYRYRHRDDRYSHRSRGEDSGSRSRERRESGSHEQRHDRDYRRRDYGDGPQRRRSRSPYDRHDRASHRR